MLAHFEIESVVPVRGYRWPKHLCTLRTGNQVLLDWNETESGGSEYSGGSWEPRPPKPGDTLIVNENGLRIAALTHNLWRWIETEDSRKL